MTTSVKPNEIQLRMPSQIELLDVVDKVAAAIAEQLEFDEEEAHSVANSVLEAATNAIQHGHLLDSSQAVDITFEMTPEALRVTVHDFGPGFDVDAVLNADPTSPDSLLRPRGRGIFIMKSLMDEVSFEIDPEAGCTAILTKFRRTR